VTIFRGSWPSQDAIVVFLLHKVSDPKSVNSNALDTEKVNDVRHLRLNSVILACERESHHTLLTTLINKSRLAGMQRVSGGKLMKAFYNHSSRPWPLPAKESSIRYRSPRSGGHSPETPTSCTPVRADPGNADLAHDLRAIEQFGREICPVGFATPVFQTGGVATAWIGILAGFSSPFKNNR
jgi:hypothetical protein